MKFTNLVIFSFAFFFYRKFEQAMQVISEHGGKYSLVSVARLYLDHLLAQEKYDEAAKLCQEAFGNDHVLWEEEVFKFVKVQKLRYVYTFFPLNNDFIVLTKKIAFCADR